MVCILSIKSLRKKKEVKEEGKKVRKKERNFSGLKQRLESTAVILPSKQRDHRYTESTVEALRFLQIQGRSLSLRYN